MITKVLENFLFNYKNYKLQKGGNNSLEAGSNILIFFISLLLLLIKSLLVMISYNYVVPRILNTYNVNLTKYRPIIFSEAILLVILFNNLFSKF